MFDLSWASSLEIIMILRLLVAVVFGGIVGMERGSGDRPAGFRTHILVCAGSALFMLVSLYGVDELSVSLTHPEFRRDSSRIAAQVVSGIGFLGAGTILHEGVTIRGLTTAASLWMVSAIGLAVGSGMFLLGAAATVVTMMTLVTFHSWEKRFAGSSRSERRFIRVLTRNRPGAITDITGYLADCGIRVKTMNVKTDKKQNGLVLELYIKVEKDVNITDIIRGLQGINGVIALENVK